MMQNMNECIAYGKIIDKIKKLISLAENEAATPEEAQLAMTKAQEFLAKYKLSMRDVQAAKATAQNVNIKKKYSDVTFKKATWKGRLAWLIADNFCCYQYFRTSGTNTVVFFGLEEDVETANAVFEYAVEFITGTVRMLRSKYYRLGRSTKGLENDYAQGFIVGLKNKYDEQKAQNQEWALVLIKPQAVIESYKAVEAGFSKSHINSAIRFFGHSNAWQRGREDGENFEMIGGHIGQ